MRSHVITSVLAIVLGVAGPFVSAIGFPEVAIAQEQTDEIDRTIEEGWQLFNEGSAPSLRRAIIQLEVSLKLSRSENLTTKQGLLLFMLGLIHSNLGEVRTALEYFNQALPIFQLNKNRFGEGTTLNNIGAIYSDLDETSIALNYFQQALKIRRNAGDKSGEGNTLSGIGNVYYNLEEMDIALEYFDQALTLFHIEKNVLSESITYKRMGDVYFDLGKKEKSLQYYNQSLYLIRLAGNRLEEASTLSSIGKVYSDLGEKKKSLQYYDQSLRLIRSVGNRVREALILNDIGLFYSDLGEYDKALGYLEPSLSLSRIVKNRSGEASTLNNIGWIYDRTDKKQKALTYYNDALIISHSLGNKSKEAIILNNIGLIQFYLNEIQNSITSHEKALLLLNSTKNTPKKAIILNNLGYTYNFLGKYRKAAEYYNLALPISRVTGNQSEEAKILSNIASVMASQKQTEVAIVLFKQSIRQFEFLRKDIKMFPEETQKAYIKSIETPYRKLADLLLKADRILEAQEVLELLKIQEFDSSFKESRGDRSPITFRKAELELLEQFNAQQQGVILAIQELTTLQNKPEDKLTKQDRDRIEQLNQLQTKLSEDFIQFINGNDVKTLVKTLQRKDSGSIDPEILEKLRNKFSNQLAQLPNTALFYPLILDDRLELILITANANPIRRTVKIDRPTLNSAIADFRLALKDPRKDAKPSAQRLHDILIQPIAADLKAANIKTLLYSPDRRLRYVPLGALHDGQQWLTQTLKISYITAASITDLITPRQPQPKVLAGAISDRLDQRYTVNAPPIYREFSGLRNVIPEIATIAKLLPNTRQLREQDFTSDAIQQLSQQYNILHFATHGSFERQDPKSSFILFGGKSRDGKNYATLEDIANWKLNTDLVVLSACETGLADDQFDTKADDSVAVMGLAYKFEQAGARATIASLWVVNDSSTALMMQHFYTHLTQGKTKVEALQLVQQDFIAGRLKATDAPGRSREPQINLTVDPGIIDRRSSLTDYTHPYFWAPFILIGNSR